ncbi:hypothetical protein [Corynebacterium gerontici]|uniref:DUF3558 domain-containing protein n=1 Tax=Corynebacterium gerontici TaxID=2079234 RepID=A0A3G6J621_9CORY|nr:hypothetical protein [Corynebacterium gerontici]AZA11900.1 hypothetical protein CGERO_08015 [Corynebacterium gerontici]
MNNLQAFRRPPFPQANRPGRVFALCIALAAALLLAGCRAAGSVVGEGALVAQETKAVRGESELDASGSDSDQLFTSDGTRVYLGEIFEPDVNKTDFFDVCGQVPEELLRKYELTPSPEEWLGSTSNPGGGVSVCGYFVGEKDGDGGVVTLMSTLQSNDVKASMAPEEIHGEFFPLLPDARYFGAPGFSSLCEVSMDTSRGRIAVGGGFGIDSEDKSGQCRRNAEILYQLIAISKGESVAQF